MAFSDTLRHKVSIQARSKTRDAAGQPVEAWAPIATPWADIKHLGGLETIKGGAETAQVKASIRMRYRTDVDESMRVVHGATVYEIKAVLPELGRKRWVDLVCEVVR